MNEKTREILHSSKKEDWKTPRDLFEKLNKQYNFTLDLCASEYNALLPRYCDNVQEGYLVDKEWNDRIPIDWKNESFFCNPPYGSKIQNILNAIPSEAQGIFLLPSRTGTKWWQDLALKCNWCLFIKGRLTFEGAGNPAPFDSILMGMKENKPQDINGIFTELNPALFSFNTPYTNK